MSEGRLRRVGVQWKPRPGAKSLGSGSITVNGLKQRFVILRNDRKAEGSKDPDYVLMSGDEPEIDQYARDRDQPSARDQARTNVRAAEPLLDDEIPF
jgi:hypothetical protein